MSSPVHSGREPGPRSHPAHFDVHRTDRDCLLDFGLLGSPDVRWLPEAPRRGRSGGLSCAVLREKAPRSDTSAHHVALLGPRYVDHLRSLVAEVEEHDPIELLVEEGFQRCQDER